MTVVQKTIPIADRLMLNIDRLVKARIALHVQESSEHPHKAQLETAKNAVKSAQYALTMTLDEVEFKSVPVRA